MKVAILWLTSVVGVAAFVMWSWVTAKSFVIDTVMKARRIQAENTRMEATDGTDTN